MKPDVFLFSRTPQQDYRYLLPLPAHASDAVRAFLQSQLVQMQSGTPDGVVRFFLSDTDAVLLRLTDSGQTDLYARPIVSLEGLYCPAAEVRELWLCLPLVVPGFWESASLYRSLVKGEDIHPIPFSRLLDDFMSRSRTQPHARDMCSAIYSADAPVSFSFDAQGLHLSSQPETRGRTRWTPAEPRRCRIQLALSRKEEDAYLEAVSCGAPAYPILRGAPVAREDGGWKFAELEASARAMEERLEACGWQCSGKGGSI